VIKIKIIPNLKENPAITEELIKNSKEKWGDQPDFLKPLLLKAECAGIALEGGSIIAFTTASRMAIKGGLAIAFLATRVQAEYRNKGLAKTLIKRVTRNFIFKRKLLNVFNWLKPVYFVTATANPIVFESFRKRFHISLRQPRLPDGREGEVEAGIAGRFAELFSSGEKLNKESLLLSGSFLNSAEFYDKEEDIPWSSNPQTNSYLEDRLRLKEKMGDGLVIVSRIL